MIACGGGGGNDNPDAPGAWVNPGYIVPDHIAMANLDGTEVGDADWTCLNTPNDDVPTAVAVNLTGTLTDFQNDDAIFEGVVDVFEGTDYTNVLDSDGPTDLTGTYALTLPTGITRFGFKIAAPDYLDTFLLNQDFDANTADQSQDISAISEGVAQALPAIIGINRTEGTGVLAGALRDCQNREVSYVIATVSSESGTPTHLDGSQTYYLDSGTSLPVRHDQLAHTDTIGTFAVLELPVTDEAFIQVWGFTEESQIAQGEAGLQLLAELASPVIADTVITGSIEPARN